MNLETKKTEKLATAIYLLTSFFAESEPMKWRLRELAGKLLAQKENPAVIQETISLLNVAKNAGLISDMNHGIIHREFSLLLPQGQNIGEIFKKDREEIKEEVRPSIYLSSAVANKEPVKEPVKDKIIRENKEDGAVAIKKNNRQTVILNLLKKKKEIMVRDVSPLIESVSEKTIQRELLALVKAGILRKEGEKRWSRYSLAN